MRLSKLGALGCLDTWRDLRFIWARVKQCFGKFQRRSPEIVIPWNVGDLGFDELLLRMCHMGMDQRAIKWPSLKLRPF
jgi:hypothetical protein